MATKNINKKVKESIEKDYEFLTAEEVSARELRYTNRIMELRTCLNFVYDASLSVSQIDKEQSLLNKWLNYVTCVQLPKPYQPYAIRLYLEKMKFFENNNKAGTIDWTLAVNERSLLSQNIFRKDLTSGFLKKTLKTDFGYEYGENIDNCLKVIHLIEYFLDNETEVAKWSENVVEDVNHLKTIIQDEIREFFDRYTYRILCSEKAYMISVDAITAEYFFSTNNFQIHIWCLKNVPIRFTQLDEPRLVANLHELNMTLHIPLSMLKQNLSLRALHLQFDHVSEKAKSFSQEVTVPLENVNAGIQDLPECLLNEWLMQLKIQNRIRNDMIEKRLDYDNKMRLLQEQEEAKKKGNKGKALEEDKKKKVKESIVIKPTKEPPQIDANLYPDTWSDFLIEEQDQYLKFIDSAYNPQGIGLDEDEINLKKFLILGGVYQLCYVRKPLHYDFNSFGMTWHKDEGRLEIDNDILIPSQTERAPSRRSTRLTQRLTKHFSMKNLVQDESQDAECPWFIITIKLPEYLCNWGEPLPCHYETVTKIIEEEQVVGSEPSLSIKRKHKSSHAAAAATNEPTQVSFAVQESDITKEPDSEYLNFLESQKGRLSAALVKAFNYSKINFESIVNRASLTNVRSGQIHKTDVVHHHQHNARDTDGVLNVIDFQINGILSKPQIRHMERHLVPRLISSFKFPKEILEDELEAFKHRPKTKGGTLIRKQVNVEPQVGKNNRIFSFNHRQNNPERLFTIYPEEEPMRVITHILDPHKYVEEPQSFAQLVSIINFIKRSYKQRVSRIADLKLFKSKVKLVNRRVKEQNKKEMRSRILKSIALVESSRSIVKPKTNKSMVKSKIAINTASKIALPKTNELDTSKSITKAKSTINTPSKSSLAKAPESDSSKSIIKSKSSTTSKFAFAPEDEVREISLKESISEVKEPDTDHSSLVQRPSEEHPPKTITYSHWSTKYILNSEYDKEKCTIVLQTDRLGCLGFAFKRYEHFPFKHWTLEPSDADPENEVIFTLETQYVACVLYISGNGIRGHVTEPIKAFKLNPKMYLVIDKPLKDFREFKKRFKDLYLNIFADHDASYYIENGYFSEKHLATEMHVYNCMAVHCSQMKFSFSQWNRLASRRDIILQFVQYKDLAENTVQVHLTPEEATFVEITELCSDSVDDIKLRYDLTWRNINNYSDLHHLINSMYPSATELRCKNPKLLVCLRDLLAEIRPLSFS